MKLVYRVQKFERLEALAHPTVPLARLQRALNDAECELLADLSA
jgi:hypothetical protein